MTELNLQGSRILIVEDEYLLADDLCSAPVEAGAEIIGPVASVEEGVALVAAESPIDAAVLDINLRGKMVFPVADALRARSIPFAFATGYDEWALPDHFADTPRVGKPFKAHMVESILVSLLEPAD